MKIEFWVISKTDKNFIKEAINLYLKRLKHYADVEYVEIPTSKIAYSKNVGANKIKESELIEKRLKPTDFLILLDENGKMFDSVAFAHFIESQLFYLNKKIVFLVGGAYGFSQSLYDRSELKLSLSKMTFPHQLIRPIFLEQLYRAFTIIKGEKYHNE